MSLQSDGSIQCGWVASNTSTGGAPSTSFTKLKNTSVIPTLGEIAEGWLNKTIGGNGPEDVYQNKIASLASLLGDFYMQGRESIREKTIEECAREAEKNIIEYSEIDILDKTPERDRIARRIRALLSKPESKSISAEITPLYNQTLDNVAAVIRGITVRTIGEGLFKNAAIEAILNMKVTSLSIPDLVDEVYRAGDEHLSMLGDADRAPFILAMVDILYRATGVLDEKGTRDGAG